MQEKLNLIPIFSLQTIKFHFDIYLKCESLEI